MEDKIVKFKCNIIRSIFKSDDFKIYAVDIDLTIAKKLNLKKNKYGNYTILGGFHQLGEGLEYNVLAKEELGKFDYQYNVKNISIDKPKDVMSSRKFLNEIISSRQVDSLLYAYPNIIDKIINNDLSDIDLNKTKYIKEATFEVIKRRIVENFKLSELVSEFGGLLDIKVLNKLYQKYPSTKKIKEKMSEEPYKCLCSLSRIGFKTADAILLELEKTSKKSNEDIDFSFNLNLIDSKLRLESAILFIIQEIESNGDTRVSEVEVIRECKNLVPEAMINFKVVKKELIEKNIINIDKDEYISLKSTYNKAVYISNKIWNTTKNPIIWNFELDKYKKTKYGDLTDEQFSVFEGICNNNIHLLIGNAGSGKSMTTSAIIKMLDDNNKSYKILAPTGRASKTISGFTNRNAKTIHRGLSYIPPNNWIYNEENQLTEDIILVDEMSMTDLDLSFRLFNAIDFSRTKLLIIGDDAQLPSVGAGNVLHDFIKSNTITITRLTRVFRYGIGGLSTIATKIRLGKRYVDSKSKSAKSYGDDKGFVFIPCDKDLALKNGLAIYKKLLASKKYKSNEIMFLSAQNVGDYGTIKINKKLQLMANKDNINTTFLKFGETSYHIGDIILQNVNNYKSRLYLNGKYEAFNEKDAPTISIFNGDTGIVTHIDINKKIMVVRFQEEEVIYRQSELIQIKLGYSYTIHKSQGDQSKIVIFLTPSSHAFMLNSNLLYVGVTRASERCYQIGNPKTVNTCVKKKIDFNRKTNLLHLLKNENLTTDEHIKYLINTL